MNWKFLFDLDGTLTQKELLPEIAKEVGIFEEVNELTYKTINGMIPFHISFQQRVDLFKNIKISKVREIVDSIPLNPQILAFIQEYKEQCFIVTGNLDVWVKPLCDRIGVKSYTSIAISNNDFVTGIESILDKETVALHIPKPFVAIGEGNNDAGMIKNATIGIGYGGVHAPADSVLACATHAIYDEVKLCQFLKQLL
ncbi:phosphoserine phosphatase [Paenibacillus sp. BIHB 4019]|uniref:phosphoserine phosphatase n=1 Tax=Paenibacillus sp. BIHB 4019 TaxID=1870819 RepID=A0A1B2DCE4_9BACL|nr:HAD family phosphatase [Paenibacillus sp. BIHB 4019]ANY65376.1 phosphoserine phosphatase [Paenibacillus sp. BIHB 4019]